jgi:hypothetical protein
MATSYDTPRGVGGKIDTNTGEVLNVKKDGNTYLPNTAGYNTLASTFSGSAPTAIAVTDLTPQTPYNLPTPTNTTTARTNFAAQMGTNVGVMGTNNAEASKETPIQDNTNRTMTLLEKLGLKGARTNEIQQDFGVSDKRKAARQIENEALQVQKQYKDLIEEKIRQSGGTLSGTSESIRALERERDSRLADKSISYKIANDDYRGASEDAQAAIAAEFEPLENELDTRFKLFDVLKDDLTEKETLDYQNKLKQDNEALDSFRSAKSSYLAIAVQNGNAQAAIELKNAKTEDEVFQVAARYGLRSLDERYKLESIRKMQAEADSIVAGTEGNSGDLQAYANQYADSGKLPTPSELKLSGLTVGQVTALAKESPKPNGALVSTNTGVKSTSLSPSQEAGITALSEIVTVTLPNLEKTFPKLYTGLFGGIGGQIWTSQDRQNYLTWRAEFLSKLLVARSGAAVTEQEYERYSKLLPGEFNQILGFGSDGSKKLKSLSSSMKNSLDSVLNTQQQSIYGYSKVNVNGVKRTVGEILDIGGVKYRVLPDGTLTDII